jgi:RNA-directed DNA polymerase
LSSSWDERRRLQTPDGVPADQGVAVKPRGTEQRAEPSPARAKGEASVGDDSVWVQVFARSNLFQALKRVEGNGGAPGSDGMTVQELRPWLKEHWLTVRAALDAGSYRR